MPEVRADVIPMPLCDDPLEQVSFFPKDEFSNVLVGENPDWVFSGASLCGVIAGTKGFDLAQVSKDFPQKSVLLFRIRGMRHPTLIFEG